ncbi:MAG TPA: helix-turn-helix domain-containing protein [Parvularculaceae bacterium]|nr:helix-turn-helix domain-containing protein [Parvularculaceae bacterium]
MTPDIFVGVSQIIQWIREALERDATKTRVGIANAIGVDKSAITRLLSGERQLKYHEAEKIAEYLGASIPFGLASGGVGNNAEGRRAGEMSPIYHSRSAGDGSWMISRHEEAVDWRERAPHVRNSQWVFGLYAPDDVMTPRFRPGEVVWVDPGRPPRIGGDCLAIKTKRDGPETAVLALLTGLTPSIFEGRQYRDGNAISLDPDGWTALHVLPRY